MYADFTVLPPKILWQCGSVMKFGTDSVYLLWVLLWLWFWSNQLLHQVRKPQIIL